MIFDLCSENSGWVSEASLKIGRAFGVLTHLDGKLHALGGADDDPDDNDADADNNDLGINDDNECGWSLIMMIIMLKAMMMQTMAMVISPRFLQDFPKISQRFSKDFPNISPRFLQDFYKISTIFPQYFYKISPRFPHDFP